MPTPKSPHSYGEAQALLDRALEAPAGISVKFPRMREAFARRFDCYAVRTKARKLNAEIYPEDHPLHGRSEYERIIVSVRSLLPTAEIKIIPPIKGEVQHFQAVWIRPNDPLAELTAWGSTALKATNELRKDAPAELIIRHTTPIDKLPIKEL